MLPRDVLPRRALTIAGSDSGGGAGIQADLKTFAAHGVYGLSAITAVTAQNSREVRAVAGVPVAVVAAQIDAVVEDFGTHAVKIGMLWSAETVRVVAARLGAFFQRTEGPGGLPGSDASEAARIPVVLDPVLAAESGMPLLGDAGGRDTETLVALLEEMVPLATLVTPNLPELMRLVEVLQSRQSTSAVAPAQDAPVPVQPRQAVQLPGGEAARLAMARQLAACGPAVLAKGGHDATSGEVVDLLVIPGGGGVAERVVRFAGPRLATRATHGTGCTLSAAIAARLALGEELAAAVGGAIEYVRGAMKAAPPLGGGHGPLAHFHAWGAPVVGESGGVRSGGAADGTVVRRTAGERRGRDAGGRWTPTLSRVEGVSS